MASKLKGPTTSRGRPGCDQCTVLQVNVPAESYCRNCDEYLCGPCGKIHKVSKATKSHCLQIVRETVSEGSQQMTGYNACKDHPGKDLEFYCSDHKLAVCSTCVTVKHRRCYRVDEINAARQVNKSHGKAASGMVEDDLQFLSVAYDSISLDDIMSPKDRRSPVAKPPSVSLIRTQRINVSTDDMPRYSGAVYLPDGRVVLADDVNDCLILLDRSFKCVYILELSGRPWALEYVENHEIAVTLPNDRKVVFVRVNRFDLYQYKTLYTKEKIVCLKHLEKDEAFVCIVDGEGKNLNKSFGILSLNRGILLRHYQLPAGHLDGFSVYFCCADSLSNVYLAGENAEVLSVDCNNRQTTMFLSGGEIGARDTFNGLDIDREGNLYTCGQQSIFQIGRSRDFIIKIKAPGLCNPYELKFDHTRDKFIVTQNARNRRESVLVFKVVYNQ